MNTPKMDKAFYLERTIYYKRLRDNTDNPTLYVEYEKEMRYNFEKLRFYISQNTVTKTEQ